MPAPEHESGHGSTHTRPPHPLAGGRSRMSSPKVCAKYGADLAVGLPGGDATFDFRADRLRGLAVGLRDRLAAADRALDGLLERQRPLRGGRRRLAARAGEQRSGEHDRHQRVADLELHGPELLGLADP